MTEVVGWTSSALLLLTIASQIMRQWRQGSSQGVSLWLFIGQIVASSGFVVYSWLVNNWVFVCTNTLMLLAGAVGLGITFSQRGRSQAE